MALEDFEDAGVCLASVSSSSPASSQKGKATANAPDPGRQRLLAPTRANPSAYAGLASPPLSCSTKVDDDIVIENDTTASPPYGNAALNPSSHPVIGGKTDSIFNSYILLPFLNCKRHICAKSGVSKKVQNKCCASDGIT